MNKIRINTGVVKIEVNDQGEYIELPFGDQSFPNRVFNLLDNFQEKQKEIDENTKDFDITTEDAVKKNLEIHEFFRDEIDKVFGADTCKKTFGNIVPSVDMIKQFFEAIEPYFIQYKNKEIAKMNKYSAERAGNV